MATDDEQVCVDDYPEHDYRVMDERDGFRTLVCRRCDAETWEHIATPDEPGRGVRP